MTTLKTVAARIRSSEADYDKDAADYEGLAESASKYRKEIMALSGVDIMQDENTYKSTKQIFEEIAAVWNQMSDVSQAALAERLGGKRNMNVVMSIIQNVRDLKGAYEDSMTAAGTAAEANEIYMDSISGKIGQFKAQWDVFSNTALDSNMVKPFIGGATELLSILTKIIAVLGQLGPLITVPASIAAGKGFYNLAKDLSAVDGVVGVLSKKFVGFGDSISKGFANLKSSSLALKLKDLIAVSPGVVVAAGGAIVAGMALLGVAAYEAYESSFTGKFNNFQKKLEKSQNLEQEASAYDARIEANKSRIDALKEVKNSTGELTSAENAELQALQSQTSELLRQKDIKDSLAESAKAETAKSAYDTLQTDRFTTEAPVTGSQDHYSIRSQTLEESIASQTQSYKAYIKAREEASKKMDELAKAGKTGSSKYISWEQRYRETDQKVSEIGGTLSKDIEIATGLANALDRTTTAGAQAGATIDSAINNGVRALNEGIGKTPYDRMKELADSGIFKEANTDLSALAATGTINVNDIEKYRKKYSEFDQALRDSGINAKEAASYYSEANKQTTTFGGSVDSVGRILGYYSDDLQTIETNLGTLNQAQEKLALGEFSTSDLALLEKQFPGISSGIDATSTSFDGLAQSISNAKQESVDFLLERFKKLRDDSTTEAQKEQWDQVINLVEQMPNAIDGAIEAYGKMTDAIKNAQTAQAELNSILSGAESDVEYQTDVQAYKQMREYEKQGKIGLGNEKYWDIAEKMIPGVDNVSYKNAEKYRKKIGKWEEQWGETFTVGLNDDGEWTAEGSKKAAEVLNNSDKFMKTLSDLGGKLDYDSSTGEIKDFHFNANTLDVLASSANLTKDKFVDLVDEVSQFADLDYNVEKPLSYFSQVGDAAEAVYGKNGAFKRYEIAQSEIDKAAKENNMTSKEFEDKIKTETGGKVKITVDADTSTAEKKITDNWEKLDNASNKKADANKKEKSTVNDLLDSYKRYSDIQKEINDKGIDTSKTVFGNIDTNNRQVKEWTKESVEQYKDAIKTWGENPQDWIGSYSTVFGGSDKFDDVEIAFSPMLQTDKGAELLSRDTMYKYIDGLIKNTGEGWTTEDLLKLDSQGLEVDGKKIKNMIADVGDTAKQTGEAMHYVGKDGALADAAKNLEDVAKNATDATGKIQISEAKLASDGLLNGKTTTEFANQLSEIAGTEVEIVASVDADTTQADQKIDAITGPDKDNKTTTVNVDADTSKLKHGLDDAKKEAEKGFPPLKMDVDTSKVKNGIDEAKKQAEGTNLSHAVVAGTRETTSKIGGTIKNIVNQLRSGKKNDSTVTVDANTSPAEQKVKALIGEIEGKPHIINVSANTQGEANIKTKVSTSGVREALKNSAKDQVAKIIAKVTGKKEVDELKKSEDTVKSKKVDVKADVKGKKESDELHGSIEKLRPRTIPVKANVSGISMVKSLGSQIEKLRNRTIDIVTNKIVNHKVTYSSSGSSNDGYKRRRTNQGGGAARRRSNINGTAYKSGTWGAKESGRALGGEVGQELVVRGSRFFTIGDDGAEFFNYRKGDVIFNAAQTEALFRDGKLSGADTRAHAFIEGTAFVRGHGRIGGLSTGSSSGGSSNNKKKKKKKATKSKRRKTSRSGGGKSRSGGGKKNSKGKSKGKSKKNSKNSKNKTEAQYFDWIEVLINRTERKISNLKKTADSTFRTLSTRNKALAKEMAATRKEITYQEKGYSRYIKQANKVKVSGTKKPKKPKKKKGVSKKKYKKQLATYKKQLKAYNKQSKSKKKNVEAFEKYKKKVRQGKIDIDKIKNEDLKKKIEEYKQWYEKAIACKDAVKDLNEKLSEMSKQRFDNIAKNFDNAIAKINSYSDAIQGYIDVATTKGHQSNSKYFQALIKYDKSEKSKLSKERSKLTSELNKAMKSGKIKVYSEAWYTMRSQIDSLTTSIIKCNQELAEHQKKLLQINWDKKDYAHSSINAFADEAKFLASLVDENDIFDDNGKITKKGQMVRGLYTQSYDAYMRDADAYARDITSIDKLIAKDKTNKDLLDKRKELVENQQQSIQAAEQEKKALQDLAKNGVTKLLNSLKELIDKYTKALDSQKDLYDYNKKMKEKTSNIASLQKQLDAYAGDTSEESRQKIQKLRKDLSEAQDDLRDTQYDKYISDTKELLNDFYDNYEETINKKVDDITAVLKESIAATNANATTIASTIKSVASSVGYTQSTASKNSWKTSSSNKKVVNAYSNKAYSAKASTTQAALRKEQDTAFSIYDNKDQNKAAAKNVKEIAKSDLAKQYSFFITKKYTGKKSKAKLQKDGKKGIYSRLAYYDVDYSEKAMAKYYTGMKLNTKKYTSGKKKGKYIYGSKYKGTSAQKKAMLAWLTERGFARGVENLPIDQVAWTQENAPEMILRRSDNAILTQLKRGDSVLNESATSNIWDMANNPAQFIMDKINFPSFPVQSGGGTIQNTIDLEITLPSVTNYQEFMNAARSDPKFEKLIQAMTTDRLAGRSSKVKNSIKW